MTSTLVTSMAHNFEAALRQLEAAIADCPDELWEVDLWPDVAPTAPAEHGGLHGSAPWFLAYHALTTLDYDLSAELEPWMPPAPFTDNTWSFPNRVFTRDETLGYIDHCRARVRSTLDALTDERAAMPVPAHHRHRGLLVGVLIGSLPMHTVEHASQLRQFLTASGVAVRPLPGDRGYVG